MLLKNKILFILLICFIVASVVLSVLGAKERAGYISNFTYNEKKSKSEKYYVYHYKVNYYSEIFRSSDLYGVILNTNNMPSYIISIEPDTGGSPFGNITSTKELEIDNSIDINYKVILRPIIPVINYINTFSVSTGNMHTRILFSLVFYLTILPIFLLLLILIKNRKTYLDIKEELTRKEQIIIFTFLALITSIIPVIILNINYPLVGHDINLIRSRAYSMLLYAQKNGFSIEWATPLYGAGLLQYPNPQYHQYSPLYFITLIMPFWSAYNILAFMMGVIGFISMFFIMKDIFKLDYKYGLTDAVLFNSTAYFILHLQVGHWAFIVHPLTAFIIWLCFTDKYSNIIKILLTSVAFSIMIFSGAIQTIFFYTCFTLLGMAALLFTPNKKFLSHSMRVIISLLIATLLSISKLLPSFILSSKIDRGSTMFNSNNLAFIIKNIYNTFCLQLGGFIEHLLFIANLINKVAGWEENIGIPFLIILIPVIMLFLNKIKVKDFFKNELWKNNMCQVVFFILWIALYVDIFFKNGLIRSLIPKLNDINLHLRMGSVFIIPSIVLFLLLNKRFVLAEKNRVLFFIVINILTIYFFTYRQIYVFTVYKWPYSAINIKDDYSVWHNIKNNYSKYYVDNISSNANDNVTINDFLNESGKLNSSRLPYEPIYGYGLETFKPKEDGSPKKIVDGRFNFTHPNSLLFFTEDYPQFSGFGLDEEKDLDKFLHFEYVDFKLPKKIQIANLISLYSNIFIALYLTIYLIYYIIKRIIKCREV